MLPLKVLPVCEMDLSILPGSLSPPYPLHPRHAGNPLQVQMTEVCPRFGNGWTHSAFSRGRNMGMGSTGNDIQLTAVGAPCERHCS